MTSETTIPVTPDESTSAPLDVSNPYIGMTVTFDDPWEGPPTRFVASWIPGSVDCDGKPQETAWADAFGGRWEAADIAAGNPAILR